MIGLLLLAGLILSNSAFGQTTDASSRPNVLLIVMDAVRADHLSPYGYARKTSPTLDRVAAEGVLYESAISAAPWTLPSTASLFTGRYARDHGVSSMKLKLQPSQVTIAELLREAGYQTVGFSGNAFVGEVWGLAQGFDEFFDVWRGLSESRVDDGAEATNEWISDWLETSRDTDRPFFMFAMYFEPHFPYSPPRPYSTRFLPDGADPEQVARLRSWKHPREVGYVLKAPGMEVTEREFEILKSQYDGEISYLDSRIGELLADFKTRGILDNTIVVITSDHGEHFGEHSLMDHKMSLYEEVIRTPLIIRYPPALSAGVRVRQQVQNVSILPTVLSLAGLKCPDNLNSPPLPIRGGQAGQRYAFSEFERPAMFLDVMKEAFPQADPSPFDRALKAVRTERYKFIWSSDLKHELYDLKRDPREQNNLYRKRREAAQELLNVLEAFRRGEGPG
ncbi:MAG: sulfatase family protein [Acidobacteriota bacterium]